MVCSRCKKPFELCVCGEIIQQATRLQVLILQHPQEPDHELGSALLTHLALANSTLSIGLSWPNLAAALKKKEVQAQHWAVLYLGSGVKDIQAPMPGLHFVSQKGNSVVAPEYLEGLLVLDGTWSQAKSLWWRNPWLLKLRRVVLMPSYKSLYKELRKEPRRECLSTIEAVAEVLELLGEDIQVSQHLRMLFGQLLDKRRAS